MKNFFNNLKQLVVGISLPSILISSTRNWYLHRVFYYHVAYTSQIDAYKTSREALVDKGLGLCCAKDLQ